jgi:hypothetical protein
VKGSSFGVPGVGLNVECGFGGCAQGTTSPEEIPPGAVSLPSTSKSLSSPSSSRSSTSSPLAKAGARAGVLDQLEYITVAGLLGCSRLGLLTPVRPGPSSSLSASEKTSDPGVGGPRPT